MVTDFWGEGKGEIIIKSRKILLNRAMGIKGLRYAAALLMPVFRLTLFKGLCYYARQNCVPAKSLGLGYLRYRWYSCGQVRQD